MPITNDHMQWVELRTATETLQLPADRPQLYRWWAQFLVRPCDVKPCMGSCNIWHPTDDAANALLLAQFRVYER